MNKNPQAYIAKNRNRLKVYNQNIIYLNDDDEFQLEFFNPTDKTILAKFSFNGEDNSMGTGLVIRPAERIFLDRYLNKEKKFKFETYKFENNKQGRDATRNNGLVSISFFREKIPSHYINYNPNICIDYSPDWTYTTGTLNVDSDNAGALTFDTSNITGGATLQNSAACNTINTNYSWGKTKNSIQCSAPPSKQSSNFDVTGRVSIGSHSNQKLTNVDMEFEVFSFHNIEYKMKPIENRTSDNVATYCTSCGYRKRKSQWKVCPICGSKFEF